MLHGNITYVGSRPDLDVISPTLNLAGDTHDIIGVLHVYVLRSTLKYNKSLEVDFFSCYVHSHLNRSQYVKYAQLSWPSVS